MVSIGEQTLIELDSLNTKNKTIRTKVRSTTEDRD